MIVGMGLENVCHLPPNLSSHHGGVTRSSPKMDHFGVIDKGCDRDPFPSINEKSLLPQIFGTQWDSLPNLRRHMPWGTRLMCNHDVERLLMRHYVSVTHGMKYGLIG